MKAHSSWTGFMCEGCWPRVLWPTHAATYTSGSRSSGTKSILFTCVLIIFELTRSWWHCVISASRSFLPPALRIYPIMLDCPQDFDPIWLEFTFTAVWFEYVNHQMPAQSAFYSYYFAMLNFVSVSKSNFFLLIKFQHDAHMFECTCRSMLL
jgi:hypothetical protein